MNVCSLSLFGTIRERLVHLSLQVIRDQLKTLFNFMDKHDEHQLDQRVEYEKNHQEAMREMMNQMLTILKERDRYDSSLADPMSPKIKPSSSNRPRGHLTKLESTLSVLSAVTEQHNELKEDDLATRTWNQWMEGIDLHNKKLQKQIKTSDRDELLERTHENPFQTKMSNEQQKIVLSLLTAILNDHKEKRKETNQQNNTQEMRWWRHFERSFRDKTPKWYQRLYIMLIVLFFL